MKRPGKREYIILSAAILIGIGVAALVIFALPGQHYTKEDPKEYAFVREYITKTYDRNVELTEIRYTHNSYGITGGLFMYTLKTRDIDTGREYIFFYNSYAPLSEDTVNCPAP